MTLCVTAYFLGVLNPWVVGAFLIFGYYIWFRLLEHHNKWFDEPDDDEDDEDDEPYFPELDTASFQRN